MNGKEKRNDAWKRKEDGRKENRNREFTGRRRGGEVLTGRRTLTRNG
jgi:hypothetical protein